MIFIKKCLFFLIFLCSSSTLFAYEHELTVCAVFKDEAPYMREWVEFHMAQGVQRFYLYDNFSCDLRYLELEDYIGCGIVEIIPWPYDSCDCKSFDEIRCKAYMHCIHRIKNKARWCAFLDCNEFLFCPNSRFLDVFLRKYKKYPCLSIHRQVYGTSNIVQAPCGQLIRYLLWKCHPKHECCKSVKSIVQPKFVIGCECPHRFILKPGSRCINTSKKPTNKIVIDKIRINHYVYRDLNFYYSIRHENRCCCFSHEWGFDLDLNFIFDDCILNVCPPIPY